MRGFLATTLGMAILFLTVSLYSSWISTKDVHSSFSSYIGMERDVYKRAALENEVYITLLNLSRFCTAALEEGQVDLNLCSSLANLKVKNLVTSYGIYPSSSPIGVKMGGDGLHFVVVHELRGRIGNALFRLPLGAEVGPSG